MSRFAWLMLGSLALLAGLIALSLGMGAVALPLAEVWRVLLNPGPAADQGPATVILWQLRLPRILLVICVGATLGVTGAAFQGLFRNPLADPFVIGASSGAALGATLSIALGLGAGLPGLGNVTGMAFAGSLGAVALVSLVGGLGGAASPVTLILAGAAVSTMLSALVSFLMLLDDQSLQAIFTWLMGGFVGRGWSHLASAWPAMALGLVWLLLCARPLDALTLGEETAAGLGLNLAKARATIIIGASLATAAAVSISGIIGFVGLVAPHGARLMIGGSHRRVLPLSAVWGALLLLAADDFARTILAPVEVPVGIVTAFLGGPFFLLLLARRGDRVGFAP